MSVVEVAMYVVECDRLGCTARAGDHDDYSGFGDHGGAYEQARDQDWDTDGGDGDGDDYCPTHVRPRCVGCDELGPDLLANSDGEAECATCRDERVEL